ncbi:MAG: peptidase, partial [Flavobacteriaceae bacterium]|nr:peptidase [Flavobacteriaceae bacterium]
MKKILYLFVFFAVCMAQAQDFNGVISSYLSSNRAQLGLEAQDITDITVTSQSYSKSLDAYTVYASQRFQNIEVFNSTSAFAIKNGAVVAANLSFEKQISQKYNTVTPSISPASAITKAAQELGLSAPTGLNIVQNENGKIVYNTGGISLENIPVKLAFQPLENNSLRLAWDLSIYLLDASHWYHVRIDAVTGELLSTIDWVSACDFGEAPHSHKVEEESILFNTTSANGGVQYRVFPIPTESPNHGPDVIVNAPADLTASPFGWHDTNGVAGADFTITRGNNVWAQEDQDGNNGVGYSPDGGAALIFDFPYNFNTAPQNMVDATTTNLFYMNNIMHDVWYQYGFDEESGNFQENNYGNGGAGSDSVNADSQDGSGLNNANFGTPPDGQNPRMQMFLWSASGPPGEPLTINNGPLAGTYEGVAAGFGAPLPTTPLTADLALVEDTTADTSDACDPIVNGSELVGKIAVIRRGGCEFGVKVLAAEDEGAVAAIVVQNVNEAPFSMGAGAVGGSVTIPSIMVSQADGEAIIAELMAGGTVNGSLEESGPFQIDGDLDNGIVAHEYGHGISNRLTGGPNNTSCLGNDEQMGEGWSDWFALMLTILPGQNENSIRGIGTYAIGQPTNGGGIRPRPYTYDMTINELTYDDTNDSNISQPHGIGSIWATMLWDLNWKLVDQYGFDPDVYTGTGGNNIAMQLVIDGLKLQNCNPGFVDGRDAILLADEIANGGANRCLIWTVFSRRGLGFSADQGSSSNRFD